MKISEFYEKYLVIKLSNGKTVKPKPLTGKEKQIYDLAEESGVPPYIRTRGRRSSFGYEIHPLIKEKLLNIKL